VTPKAQVKKSACLLPVTHADPHENVSTEVHRSGRAPFTPCCPSRTADGPALLCGVWKDDGAGIAAPAWRLDATACSPSPPAETAARKACLVAHIGHAQRAIWPIIQPAAPAVVGERIVPQ